jgi:3-isopropylmalate dehydratase small subunit
LSLINGITVVLGNKVNTDIHCSSKYLPDKDVDYISEHAFEKLSPSFQGQVRNIRDSGKSVVLVAGEDFGINSSREQAAQILKTIGVSVILAPSFARAFFRNSINNGLALLRVDTSEIKAGVEVRVELSTGAVAIQGSPLRQADGMSSVLLDIVSAGGLLNYLDQNKGWPEKALING